MVLRWFITVQSLIHNLVNIELCCFRVEYSYSYKLSVVTLLSSAQELQSPYADTGFFQLKSRGRALDIDHHCAF